MHYNMQLLSRFRRYSLRNYWIVVPWLLALFLGTYCAFVADSSVLSLVRQTVFGRVSTVCLMSAQFLPFLIVAYAAFIPNRIMTVAVCACKMFLFTFSGALVWIAFGSAGWLIRSLFLFSDICLFPVLLWFSLRQLTGVGFVGRDFWICCGFVAAIVFFDRFFVSPLLGKLI